MLAPSWPYSANTHNANYLPPRPSPLSPRSANAYPPRFTWGMSLKNNVTTETNRKNQRVEKTVPQERTPSPLFPSPQHFASTDASNTSIRTQSNTPTPFSQRGGAKPNPLLRREDGQRERRRDLFMKRVEQGREDRRWEGRSEQILRSDYILQQRKWEEERARSAPNFIPDFDVFDEEEHSLATSMFANEEFAYPSTPRLLAHQMEDEVDAVAQMEEQELRELVALAEEPEVPQIEMHVDEQNIPSSPTRYGSDEDDYDDIFMEIVSLQAGLTGHGYVQPPMQQQEIQEHHEQEDIDMDMSNG